MIELLVTSAAFAAGAAIPDPFTCIGANISPPLAWSAPPAATQSIAILVDDPDAPAGDWVHWILFNLPPETTTLPEHMPAAATLPDGAIQGINDFRRVGYGGPCPPPGAPHRYVFKVFALDIRLQLKSSASKKELLAAMRGHILAQGQLIGTFKR